MRFIAIVPSKAAVYLGLGLMPFLIELSAARSAAEHRVARRAVLHRRVHDHHPVLTGVGGLFLDIFFQKSTLDRKTTIATKAVTQTFSHIVRAVYFGSLVEHERMRCRCGCSRPRSLLSIAGHLARRERRTGAHDRCRVSRSGRGA